MKTCRVLYNQDATNLFGITREPVTPGHVDRMVDEVADAGADVLLVNPNAQRVNYPSRVWQTFWDGYEPGRRAFFGAIPDADLPLREAWVTQMKRLADAGCDYLARALARCRQRAIVPGVSVRMNDMHDAPTPGTHLFSRFYMENPGLRLDNPSVCGWSARGLNYEHRAVRDHMLALVGELARGYDLDVLELDFLRFSSYFPRADFAAHAATMTDFVREVRAALAAAGRRIALTVRVPATPASARELGLDAAAWAREGLIDGLSAGAFLNTQWAVPVAEWRRLAGDSVALYACTDYPADRRAGLPPRFMPLDPALLRGFAAGHLAAGADGVELFNFFCAREEAWGSSPRQPRFDAIRDLRSLAGLRGLDKTYTLMSGWAVGEVDGPVQVPLAVEQAQPRLFTVLAAGEEAGRVSAQAAIAFAGGAAEPGPGLWLHVNGIPAGPAASVGPLAADKEPVREAVWHVPPEALRDGPNTLVLRNEGKALTVVSIDLRVRPRP